MCRSTPNEHYRRAWTGDDNTVNLVERRHCTNAVDKCESSSGAIVASNAVQCAHRPERRSGSALPHQVPHAGPCLRALKHTQCALCKQILLGSRPVITRVYNTRDDHTHTRIRLAKSRYNRDTHAAYTFDSIRHTDRASIQSGPIYDITVLSPPADALPQL